MLDHHPDRIPLDRLPSRYQALQTDRLRYSRPMLSVAPREPRSERHRALQAVAMQIDDYGFASTRPGNVDAPRPGRHRCAPASADRRSLVLVGALYFAIVVGIPVAAIVWAVLR